MEEQYKEVVEVIDKKLEAQTINVNDKFAKETKKLQEAAEKEKKELNEKWQKDHDTLIEQGATIENLLDENKNLKARMGRNFGGSAKFEGLRATIADEMAKAIGEAKADIMASTSGQLMKPIEIKTVANIASANLTVDNFISYLDWRPGMEPTGQFHFRNLVRTILSDTDFVQFPRANTPIGEGSFARVAEAVTKPQVDRDYTMVQLTLLPMAAYVIASRQSLRNIIFLQTWLPQSMMEQMEDSEDTDFANTLVAAATGSTTTTRTVAPEKVISYIKNLIVAKYNPNGVAVDPAVWEDFLVYRPGTAGESYSNPFVTTVTPNGQVTILGRPVYPVNWLTGRRIIVGDWTKAAIVQSEGLRLRQTDSHASLFTSNEICFLLERTEGLAIFRPNAFVTTTV